MAVNHPDKGKLEKKLLKEDYETIYGVDEVGRGCIAGPVFAACVQLDFAALSKLSDDERSLIRDSKTQS